MVKEVIKKSLDDHRNCLECLEDNAEIIHQITTSFIQALQAKGKILFMGNGGSAADSQHLAAELIGRFKKNRASLAAIALTTDTSILTAVGNDFGFEDIFSRQIESLANPNDIVVGISTSGKSANVIKAIKKAKERGIKTVAFLGGDGGDLKQIVDLAFIVPTTDTPRIQEMHILAGHIICEIVEGHFTQK